MYHESWAFVQLGFAFLLSASAECTCGFKNKGVEHKKSVPPSLSLDPFTFQQSEFSSQHTGWDKSRFTVVNT